MYSPLAWSSIAGFCRPAIRDLFDDSQVLDRRFNSSGPMPCDYGFEDRRQACNC
jgi:hypothetical protein